ncbi:flagellar biosynthesis protein FlhA [uncultured Thioclava sp.]|uniref:flagellar biosynthesis protein FlhA n=1 Tax=uncultured Thioclava sp. TaxID=473858 RepID=UPI00345779AF
MFSNRFPKSFMPTPAVKPVISLPRPSITSWLAGPAIVGAVLTMLIVPLSPLAISLMFAVNIAAGLVILAAAIYVTEASDLLSFPSILLATTLMRLGLNVATARAILLNGYTGPGAAGSVVESFGRLVVGGNYVIGIIIFCILIVINFVVITKGSSRVAEVSARFMLDSLPGRQMAIDADVNAGTLSAKEAERRRGQLRAEADFFGAMDGASKFVRGDVVAAMVILVVNLVGGLLVGMLQHGLPLAVAAQSYTLLTIGDGVAAQIPSLTISIAAGLIVTRVSNGQNISNQIVGQISNHPEAMLVAGALLLILGLVPGMAHLPFLGFGAILGATGLRGVQRKRRAQEAETAEPAPAAADQKPAAVDVSSVQTVDPFGLDIGFALVPLIGEQAPGKPTLMTRLTAIRTRFSKQIGFVLPNIHIRDSEQVRPQEYRFVIRGGVIGRGEVFPGQMLAIETDNIIDRISGGRPAKEPVFGTDALWIGEAMVADAETAGYTVVDPSSVIATHLDAMLKRHAWEMLGRGEVEEIVGHYARSHPKLIEDLRARYQMGMVRQVLSGLVAEMVPIRDFERIAEAMVDAPEAATRDPEMLLAAVRQRISRLLIAPYLGEGQVLQVLALDPEFEGIVIKSIETARAQNSSAISEPGIMRMLRAAAASGKELAASRGVKPVLAVPGSCRRAIARVIADSFAVIALEEIPDNQPTTVLGVIRPPEEAAQ